MNPKILKPSLGKLKYKTITINRVINECHCSTVGGLHCALAEDQGSNPIYTKKLQKRKYGNFLSFLN